MIEFPIQIDIIILSYAKTDYLRSLTEQTIQTLLESEDPAKIKFEILVIESEKSIYPFQFKNTKTVYPKQRFGFNKYLNIGISRTNNKFICFCNNDIVFHHDWASEILTAIENDDKIWSVNPYCRNFHTTNGFPTSAPPLEGYFGVFTGWCFFVKRTIFDKIGLLDENLTFWYCDNDYLKLLLKYKLKNMLISTSFITHIGSESLKISDQKLYKKLTLLPQLYYNYKWNHQSIIRYNIEKLIFKFKLFFQS